MNIYCRLTREFNDGKTRAILSSGQAVVLHRLAIMSKDGDWIISETEETMGHVLSVLARRGAVYRFGAPLDVRWMQGGWSSHLEFVEDGMRVRTDFVTRPPRLTGSDMDRMWEQQEGRDLPVVDIPDLIEIKKTNKEKDYAVIGELARKLESPKDQLLSSRSARDILALFEKHPALLKDLIPLRTALAAAEKGLYKLEQALDAERRGLIHANEKRLESYMDAAKNWRRNWPELVKKISKLELRRAHDIMVSKAEMILPFHPEGEGPGPDKR